jgi:hypothetical protein
LKGGSVLIFAAVMLAAFAGCGSDGKDDTSAASPVPSGDATRLPDGGEPANLDPKDFTRRIDNPYWPMAPDGKAGRTWGYRGKEGGEPIKIVVTVTDDRKKVQGIDALTVSDTVTQTDGTLVENTVDWFGQDSAGNVWYLGEDTKEYEEGRVVSTAGSWEAGVDGAQAGIIIPAEPKVGQSYRQEYYEGEAEDEARVVALDATADVPFGHFQDCLKTRDTTPLEPNLLEFKYYAKGVGPVLKEGASGAGREELVSFERPN